ncbi:transporter [Polynucleobacter sp. MWH-CaK5]|uniref:transporter n=1 Tax=Polynucleobacter sp. MWH-CaK5 TaxID=2689107 RepID=UPI001BFD14AC|nr:transporter [Polynucleobacter sp. MWH-CaK5]QWD89596.1 transporter [Polynucleobacter sp. MWH-CaK5]
MHQLAKKSKAIALATFAVASGFSMSSWAIDLQPGDATAPPPGLRSVQLSYLNAERVGASNARIDQNQVQFRYTQAFEVNKQPALFYLHTGTGRNDPSGAYASLPADNGMIDTTLVFAYWPYVDRASKTYVGVAGYLITPTGSYSSGRDINMGENRYRWAGQIAYQTRIAPDLDWMSAFDTLWFGKNDAGRLSNTVGTLEQKALYSAQTGFLYHLNKQYSFAAAYFYSEGGETIFNGGARNNSIKSHRYQLSAIRNSSIGRFTLQYGQDIDNNAALEDKHRIFLRYTKFF